MDVDNGERFCVHSIKQRIFCGKNDEDRNKTEFGTLREIVKMENEER